MIWRRRRLDVTRNCESHVFGCVQEIKAQYSRVRTRFIAFADEYFTVIIFLFHAQLCFVAAIMASNGSIRYNIIMAVDGLNTDDNDLLKLKIRYRYYFNS